MLILASDDFRESHVKNIAGVVSGVKHGCANDFRVSLSVSRNAAGGRSFFR